jgi:hypothetical protein
MAEILGAVVGGLGAFAQYQAAQESAMIQLANLQFQKRMADEQMRMSQATRTDAYGNQQRYNPSTNAWETILTPTQKEIVGAGEQEQLKRLTEDATRNRLILEEQRQRGLEAVPDYNKALAGFRYDQAPSRASDEDKLASLLALQNEDQAGAQKQAVGRVLLRQGRGSDFAAALKAIDDTSGQNIGGNLAKAYQASIPQFAQDVQQRQQHYLPLLDQLQKTMAMGSSSAPAPFSTVPAELNAIEGQQADQIRAAMASGASAVGGAYNNYAKAAGEAYPNLSSLASLISKIGSGKSGQPQYGLVPNTSAGNQTSYDPGVGYAGGGGQTYGYGGGGLPQSVPLPPIDPRGYSSGDGAGFGDYNAPLDTGVGYEGEYF